MTREVEKEKYEAYEMYAEWGGYQGYHLSPRLKIEKFVNECLVSMSVFITIGVLLLAAILFWVILRRRQKCKKYPNKGRMENQKFNALSLV